jgi:hypothetical protein
MLGGDAAFHLEFGRTGAQMEQYRTELDGFRPCAEYQKYLGQHCYSNSRRRDWVQVTFERWTGRSMTKSTTRIGKSKKGSPYLSPMIGTRARSATVRAMPREKQHRE